MSTTDTEQNLYHDVTEYTEGGLANLSSALSDYFVRMGQKDMVDSFDASSRKTIFTQATIFARMDFPNVVDAINAGFATRTGNIEGYQALLPNNALEAIKLPAWRPYIERAVVLELCDPTENSRFLENYNIRSTPTPELIEAAINDLLIVHKEIIQID